MCANDCVIYRPVSNHCDAEKLQHDLDHVQEWCHRWLMTLNLTKCKLLSITRQKCTVTFPYAIAIQPMLPVIYLKHLGVTFSNDLTWHAHVTNVISSANRVLGFLKRHLRHAPKQVIWLAYKSLIRSKVEYLSSIWSAHQVCLVDELEAVQNRAARFMHSSYSHEVRVTALKAESELRTLSLRRRIATHCLFHKLFYSSLNSARYITPPAYISRRTGHQLQVSLTRLRTGNFSASFFSRAAKDWNGLPNNIVTITCPSSFSAKVSEYLLWQYWIAYLWFMYTHPLCNTPFKVKKRNEKKKKSFADFVPQANLADKWRNVTSRKYCSSWQIYYWFLLTGSLLRYLFTS